MRYYTSIRMAIIKKSDNNCWLRCGETGTLTHGWWDYQMVQILWENSLAVSQTFKQRIIIVPAISHLDTYFKKIKNRYSKKYFCIYIVGLFTIAKR